MYDRKGKLLVDHGKYCKSYINSYCRELWMQIKVALEVKRQSLSIIRNKYSINFQFLN